MKRFLALAAFLAGVAIAAPPAGNKVADEANAAGTQFKVTTPSAVSYGIDGTWIDKILDPGQHVCHPVTFGLPGTMTSPRKQCKFTFPGGGVSAPPVIVAPVPLTGASSPVMEEGRFTLSAAMRVSFGKGATTIVKSFAAGTHPCSRDAFGSDPLPGVVKECRVAIDAAPPVVVVPPPVVVVPTTPAQPVDSDVSNPATYRTVAATFGTDAGIAYRYGAPSSLPLPSTSYFGPRPDKSYADTSGQIGKRFSDGFVGNRGCGKGTDSFCGTYQIGEHTGNPLDYSSNIVNVAYVPTLPVPAGFLEPKYWGIASLQTLGVNHNSIALKPEPSWTTWTGPRGNNGDNDENTRRMAGAASGSPIGSTGLKGCPIAATRGYGRGGWVNNTLAVDCEGRITSSGSNTSHNFVNYKLPAGFAPTAIAITNSGEFALVTGWDTAAIRGRVAVLALTEGCQWCETTPDAQWRGEWGNHRGRFPGMPGLGNYLDIKLVGFVDLPADMKAPTEISATTGNDGGRDTGYQVIMNFWDQPLTDERIRKRIRDEDYQRAVSRTGMAVVISKSERRAAFIDLRPLFSYYRAQYFNVDAAGWNALLAKRGPNPDQWPYSFDVAPAQRPTIAKVVSFAEKPTAVNTSRRAPHRALIATEDGKLRVFDLGANYLKQEGGVGAPSDIAELFTVDVGRNPTSIAFMKEKGRHGPGGASLLFGAGKTEEQHWWVLSREERKATLLQFNAAMTSAAPIKTLHTRQIVDPIAIDDGDNHGTESYLLTVADYSGSAVHNLWYGPIVMWTHLRNAQPAPCRPDAPCTPHGGAELAGTHRLPGKPFHLSGSNIN